VLFEASVARICQ